MGLLDDLLDQLSGPGAARTVDARAPRDDAQSAAAGGMDTTKIMMALLPVVLGMLTSGQRGRSAGFDRTGTGGGLGDILGQVLGGSSAGSGNVLGGLLEGFQRAGFGEQARSWVSTGRNQPIPPAAVEEVFGTDGITEIARRAGLSERDASRGLSELMPEVVDHVTPDGNVPDFSSLQASVESLTKRLGA